MKILRSEFNYLLPSKVKKLIRLGRDYDGGYVVCKETLSQCKNLISLGVGDDISFERDFEKFMNVENIHLYDYTVNYKLFFYIILKYLRRFLTFRASANNIADSINNFLNFKKFIAQSNVKLFKEKVVSVIEETNNVNLEKIFSRIKSEKDNLLKIDIEGSEYEIIDEIIEHHAKVKMLIIEFHWINKNPKLFEEAIKKLNDKFKIIHIHVNNYIATKESDYFFDVVEISFIKKDKTENFVDEFRYDFPIENLDYECIKNGPKIKFSFSR
tara:strand:+ start:159 stop:968 length:810 start_codon:yes stop_codon:yes gene_type:complete